MAVARSKRRLKRQHIIKHLKAFFLIIFFITMVKPHHKSPTVSVVVWRVHCQLVFCPSRPSIHHYHSHHLHQTLHELNTTVHIHIHHMATKSSPHVCCCMRTAFWCQTLNFCHIVVLVMSCYIFLVSEAQATSID